METDRRLLPWAVKRDAAGPILYEAQGKDYAVDRRDSKYHQLCLAQHYTVETTMLCTNAPQLLT